MTIDIKKNKIVINDINSSMRIADKSQLQFWNFSSDTSFIEYQANCDEQLFMKLINYFDKEGYKYELQPLAAALLKSLQEKNYNFNLIKQKGKDYKNGKYNKLDFENFKDFVFGNIKRPLKIHQLKAAYHLYILGSGANFSVPGSGKTSVVITVYEKLRLEGKVNTLFIVGPPSCFGPWKNEFLSTLGRKPFPVILAGKDKNSRKIEYHKTSRQNSELYLTTFHSLLSDQEHLEFFLAQKDTKVFFVIDEAHYIKQINGNWASALLKQSKKVRFRCVLTGTPMPKSYTDIYNLFDFLWPESHPISQTNKIKIKHSEQIGDRLTAKTILDLDVGPLFYRVRKSDLKLTIQNFPVSQPIKMNHYERLIYDAIFKKITDYSKNDYFKNINFINKLGRGRIIRLRQSISYSRLLNIAIDDYNESLLEDVIDIQKVIKNYDSLEIPAKITHLLKITKAFKAKKNKVVIWSNFIETIKLIEKHLKENGYYCKKIFGGTPIEGTTLSYEETREKIRDEFVNPSSGLDILIANPAACAESISLHKTCHHAIYYDLSYNCAQYLQSLDRIHRVGGSERKIANYHFLQYKNTIDIDIKQNLDQKTKKMYEIIEQDYPIHSLNMFDSEENDDADAYKRLFKNK